VDLHYKVMENGLIFSLGDFYRSKRGLKSVAARVSSVVF